MFDESAGQSEAFCLAAGETERVIISIDVVDHMRHEWALRIPYVRRGKRGYINVRSRAGAAFTTNGYEGLEHWLGVDGRWIKARTFLD